MTVKDLKQLLSKAPDEMQVLMPMTDIFDGYFKSPCVKESGVATLGVNENLKTEEDSFVIVPCGFFEEHEGPSTELN